MKISRVALMMDTGCALVAQTVRIFLKVSAGRARAKPQATEIAQQCALFLENVRKTAVHDVTWSSPQFRRQRA